MIVGRVNRDLDPLVTIGVADSSGSFRELEVVLDTGFEGDLTLPQRTIQRLGLKSAGQRRVTLALGEERMADCYLATVSWLGQHLQLIVIASEDQSLLGMSLLKGSRVTLDVRENGEVVVE